jgi:hypothetical protein
VVGAEETVGVDRRLVALVVSGQARERQNASLALAARLGGVGQDPEDPGLQGGASLEAFEPLEDAEPGLLYDLLGNGSVDTYIIATRSIDGPYRRSSSTNAASSPARSCWRRRRSSGVVVTALVAPGRYPSSLCPETGANVTRPLRRRPVETHSTRRAMIRR